MELQNIIVDFNKEEVNSLFENVNYLVPFSTVDFNELKTAFETAYNDIFSLAVVQLTVDQYSVLAEPRIITFTDDEEPISNKYTIESISTEHPVLFSELQDARALIEAEITSQLS